MRYFALLLGIYKLNRGEIYILILDPLLFFNFLYNNKNFDNRAEHSKLNFIV